MVTIDDSSGAGIDLSTSRYRDLRPCRAAPSATLRTPQQRQLSWVRAHTPPHLRIHPPPSFLIWGSYIFAVFAAVGTLLLIGLFADTFIAWRLSARRPIPQEPPPAKPSHPTRVAAAFTGLAGCAALAVFSLSTAAGYERTADSYKDAVADAENALAHPAVPPTALDAAAASSEPRLRAKAAQHPGTNLVAVAALAADSDPAVRAAVVRRSELPDQIITQLAPDPDPVVRLAIAQRSDTPPAVLAALALDSDNDVRAAAVANDNTPPSGLEASLRDALSVIDPAPAQR